MTSPRLRAPCPAGGQTRRGAWLLVGPLLFATMAAACNAGEPAALTVFAAASLTDAFREIGARFEAAHPGIEVQFAFGGSQRLRFQLAQGAAADVFASADAAQIDVALADGTVRDPRAFAANALALVTPADNPADIQALADLARPGVRLILAGPDVPAGRLARQALDAAGLTDPVQPAIVSQEDNVRQVLTKISLGEADAAFVYRTDALSAPQDVHLVPLPEPVPLTGYFAARTTQARSPSLAGAFVAFLGTADAQAVLLRYGFQPALVAAAPPP